ncbi:MAG: SCP2 sterol-binding domain-containing protein [Acidimicrobiales bacterium]
MSYTFLSDEWLAEAKKIGEEAGAGLGTDDLVLNIVVTGGADGDKEINISKGVAGVGLVDDAPTKLTVPYDVAKQIFVDGNQQAGMQAFMAGQIKIEGDMTKVMALQSAPMTPERIEFGKRLKGITAE